MSTKKKSNNTNKKNNTNAKKVERIVEEKTVNEDSNTTSLSVIKKEDLDDFIEEDLGIKNNVKEGKGILYYKNKEKYEGDWKNNAMHGFGVFTWEDFTKYKGESLL